MGVCGYMEWGWRDCTLAIGWEHWKRNKNISFPGIFCGLAIPISDTVPKMPCALSWCRVLLSLSAVTGPGTALPMEQMCSCWGEQTQPEVVGESMFIQSEISPAAPWGKQQQLETALPLWATQKATGAVLWD